MKQIIKEEKTQTVNDVQLKDLYEASAKTEQQIINLCVASMSFSNAEIKKTAVALKSQASQLTQLIGSAMQEADNVNLSAPGLPGEGPQDLEAAPGAEQMIGEVVNGLKKIVEAFDFQRDVLDKKKDGKEDKKDAKDDDKKDKEEIKEDEMPATDTIPSITEAKEDMEKVDLKESYKLMTEGTLKSNKFEAFKTNVIKALEASKSIASNAKGIAIIESVKKSGDISEINECFNTLYDFADETNIEIITE